MIAQAVLLLLLVVSYPFWERYEMRMLKGSADPDVRVKSYRRTILLQWVVTLLLLLLVGLRLLARLPVALPGVAAQDSQMLPVLLGGAATGLLVPVVLALWNPALREKLQGMFASIDYFLPQTGRERSLFALLCVTAGVCEEIIFRGWMIRYFHALPLGLTLWESLGMSAALFGLVHWYQGLRGVLLTALMGGLFSFVFFLTGSLTVPIILHVLVDLRVLLLMPRVRTRLEQG